ncbi:MAG: PAS domain S-box protein [Deltaproteobacteria bacterium]|nr:PAS domain S-box protein [Deltaproteobacteria bacterium]
MPEKPTYEEMENKIWTLEKALTESENRFRILLRNSSDIQAILDENGVERFISDSVEAITGFSPEQIIGKSGFEFIHPEDIGPLLESFKRFKKRQSDFARVEYRHRKKDGSWLNLEAVGMNLLEDPSIKGIVLNVRDVTRERQAEKALLESQSRLQSTFSAAPVGLSIVKDRVWIAVNATYCDMMGYTENEMVGKDTRILYDDEDERNRVGRKMYDHLWESGISTVETRHLRKDGEFRDIFMRAAPVSPEDPGKGVVVAIEDITQRKRVEKALQHSEERYRSIVENIQEGYYEVDLAGNFSYTNESLSNVLGYEKNEMMGMNYRRFTSKTNVAKLFQVFNKVYRDGAPAKVFDWEVIRKDGATKIVEASVALIKDLEGHRIGFRGIARDVTEEKRIKDQLQRAEKMETVGTLAGGVAHDLNNLLSGIVSYPELLLLQLPEDSPFRKPIATIQKSGEKAVAVVQDLLTLARRAVMPTEPVDLNQVVSQFLSSPEYYKIKEYYPEVQTEVRLEEAEGLTIMGSPTHLSKTVMNLLSNAVEAMPRGGRIVVSTDQCYMDRPVAGYDDIKEGDYVTLTVADTGTGISPDDIDKIFEPFYTKKKMGRSGTGLGMAVVWGTVKDHKGFIDVQSIEGEGTTFKLYFPVSRNVSAVDGSEIRAEDYTGGGELILVVDDVEQQREVAVGMLKQLGYRVRSVSGGEEAVLYLKEHEADLLLLDMIMDPGMDGLDTYRKIIEMHPGQKAVIASGFSETDRVREAQRLGAGNYLKKPFLMEKLGIAVKSELAVNRKEMRS